MLRRILPFVFILAAGACSDSTGPVLGTTYELRSINGVPLSTRPQSTSWQITGGTLVLRLNKEYYRLTRHEEVSGVTVYEGPGPYRLRDNGIELYIWGRWTPAVVRDRTLSLTDPSGRVFVYAR